MMLTGALTVWFNLQHAGTDPGRRLAAALPPVLMMLAFEIDVQIVKWVMRALGKPMGPIAPPPTACCRPRPTGRTAPTGTFPTLTAPAAGRRTPTDHRGRPPRSGKPTERTTRTGRRERADPAGMTKRQRIEEYLDRLGPEELEHLTVREMTADLHNERPGGHRALRQADPRQAAAHTPDPAPAGEWPP